MDYKSSVFDTVFDTNKIFVTIKPSFYIRNEKTSTGLAPVYLSLTASGSRERLNLKISIDPKKWDKKKQRLKVINNHDRDVNLVIDNVLSKIITINTAYRLSNMPLTPKIMRSELLNQSPRVNFLSFFAKALEDEKSILSPGSYKRYKSVLNKLKDFREELNFNDIDLSFFNTYRKHLISIGNKSTTINANFKAIKTYLRIAEKHGIKLRINIDDITAGRTTGNRNSLSLSETKLLVKYYFSDFIKDYHRLTLGYFLFSCYTGLRLSNVMSLTRKDVHAEQLQFISVKSNKSQIISLNETTRKIINHEPRLFIDAIESQVMNRQLKDISAIIGINKKIHFHVARHTFATSFLRMGGDVTKLQKLLGHSKLETTMIYVHILQEEANEEIFLLDNMFKTIED